MPTTTSNRSTRRWREFKTKSGATTRLFITDAEFKWRRKTITLTQDLRVSSTFSLRDTIIPAGTKLEVMPLFAVCRGTCLSDDGGIHVFLSRSKNGNTSVIVPAGHWS